MVSGDAPGHRGFPLANLQAKTRYSGPCRSNAFFCARQILLRLFQLSRDPHQNHRTNKRNDNLSDRSPGVEPQQAEHKASNNPAENSQNDVHNDAIIRRPS